MRNAVLLFLFEEYELNYELIFYVIKHIIKNRLR